MSATETIEHLANKNTLKQNANNAKRYLVCPGIN
jgi:hypothetical protein